MGDKLRLDHNCGFTYYKLGNKLFKNDGSIDKNCTYDQLARYLFFMETGMPTTTPDPSKHLAGRTSDLEVYLIYHNTEISKNTLNFSVLKTLPRTTTKIIYADSCTISDQKLEQYHTTFRQIPYEVNVL